jgi:hypothetical protein
MRNWWLLPRFTFQLLRNRQTRAVVLEDVENLGELLPALVSGAKSVPRPTGLAGHQKEFSIGLRVGQFLCTAHHGAQRSLATGDHDCAAKT